MSTGEALSGLVDRMEALLAPLLDRDAKHQHARLLGVLRRADQEVPAHGAPVWPRPVTAEVQ